MQSIDTLTASIKKIAAARRTTRTVRDDLASSARASPIGAPPPLAPEAMASHGDVIVAVADPQRETAEPLSRDGAIVAEAVQVGAATTATAPAPVGKDSAAKNGPADGGSKSVLDVTSFLRPRDEDFIALAYRYCLGREPDAAAQFYLEQMGRGYLSQVEVLHAISRSPEARERAVQIRGLEFRYWRMRPFGFDTSAMACASCPDLFACRVMCVPSTQPAKLWRKSKPT